MSSTLFLICTGAYLVLDRFVSHADALGCALLLFVVAYLCMR